MRWLIAGLLLALTCMGAAAESSHGPVGNWPAPRLLTFEPDWNAAFGGPARGSDDRIAQANAAAASLFPTIAASPVPVLAPFALSDYLRDRDAGAAMPAENYLSGFQPTGFFLAGPTGYDAAFSIATRDHPELRDIGFANPVMVQISGFNTLYALAQAHGAIVQPAGEIESDFPGIKRQILESTLRYSFERFGIPYVVQIQCFDGPQRRNRLSCRNAERIALRFLRALAVVGGTPSAPAAAAPPVVTRPHDISEVFTYHPAGRLLPGTAMRAPQGDPDGTVYARIRFPLASAPAYVNSQSFMHGGDCNQTGRQGLRRPGSTYRCRINGKPLAADEGAAENYSYPWRDNFCENRHFFVGRCAAGLGHQGQDIRPAFCARRHPGGGCEPDRHMVVAARDGMILREPWQNSFFLFTNAPGERLRFRHLHMHPRLLDADGITSGRMLAEGDALGAVGNFNRRPGWTTTHLHFEVQVPTRDGYVRVNPYMTLVAAYEHLIRARGTQIDEPDPEPAAESGKSESAATSVTSAKAKGKAKSKSKSKGKAEKSRPKAKSKARGKRRR